MNIQILVTLSLLSFTVLSGCDKKPEISGFDEMAWKEDKYGCLGLRGKDVDLILKNQKVFTGKSEQNLIKLLGRPDKTAFYKRNIRNFIYYTEPGSQCDSAGGKNGKRIIVELNAIGTVTWINEEII